MYVKKKHLKKYRVHLLTSLHQNAKAFRFHNVDEIYLHFTTFNLKISLVD